MDKKRKVKTLEISQSVITYRLGGRVGFEGFYLLGWGSNGFQGGRNGDYMSLTEYQWRTIENLRILRSLGRVR